MKYHILALVAFARITFATPTISNITAQQRYPWNGKVDISYTVSGDVAAFVQDGTMAKLKVTATDTLANTNYIAATLSGDISTTDGTHNIVWDMDADGLSIVSTAVVFSVSCETAPATYCVIDLSAGSSASAYPVTYLAEPPVGGFNADEYKTTKLVLKRIEAGSFMMGGATSVALTRPFFIGLFEMTQKQYALITGVNYRYTGDKRPVCQICYDTIRGSSTGSKWPVSSAVDSSSFLGKLRTKTGLDFDLPTEAQWEYACRAGTTTTYSYGNAANGNYMWYTGNSQSQTHDVGTKQPNPWGLYDMHGNVWEWCLDCYSGNLVGGVDPRGPLTEAYYYRVFRGGGYSQSASECSSSNRGRNFPSYEGYNGFRLALSINAATLSCESKPTKIDLECGVRVAEETEDVSYSSVWNDTGSVTVLLNGAILTNAAGSGSLEIDTSGWLVGKLYVLSHVDGVETLTATFKKRPQLTVFCSSNRVVSFSVDEPDVMIYYSLDGTLPTAGSVQYTSPFVLDGEAVIQAIAIRSGGVVAASAKKVVGQNFPGDDFVQDVHGRQRYPWNGLVDIGLSIVGVNDIEYDVSIQGIDSTGGTNLLVSSLSELGGLVTNFPLVVAGSGRHDVVWNADRDIGGNFKSTVELEVSAVPRYYTVTYEPNGGTGTMANQHIFNGQEARLRPVAFSRIGHSFSGWSLNAASPSTYANSESVKDLTSENGGVVSLHAVWAPNHYQVSFNSNGGSGSMANQSFTYGVAQSLSPNVFSRSGYTFQGWGTSANGSVAYANSASVLNLSSSNNGVVQLFAIWKADTPSSPTELYLVVDISGGPSAQTYPVTQMGAMPSGGWSDEYKTTKIVLRRIPAGSFTMGDLVHQASATAYHPTIRLTKDFYIGVFEITQRQWELVMGSRPSFFSNSSYYRKRPVEQVSYDMIRGSDKGAGWPQNSEVDSDSFMGRVRTKARLTGFDLPTLAEWEYACRSGTSTDYGNGTNYSYGSPDPALDAVGRNYYNSGYGGDYAVSSGGYRSSSDPSLGTAEVGSYVPNRWGLYDMHGNVGEFCLDWAWTSYYNLGTLTDPVGNETGPYYRILRGGYWAGGTPCASWTEDLWFHDYANYYTGFRLAYRFN